MRRLIALAPFAVFAALVFVFGAYALHHDPQVVPRATVGTAAPAVVLPSLDGAPPSPLRAALKGPTLVNFFAAWCVTCPQEAQTLAALKAEGVHIVGVAYKDDPAKTRAFLARYGDPYQTIFVDADDMDVSGQRRWPHPRQGGRTADARRRPGAGEPSRVLTRR
jgi:cytochrome c biogenesis protein CcmG/thiol:disulfide interchange protein DsbE